MSPTSRSQGACCRSVRPSICSGAGGWSRRPAGIETLRRDGVTVRKTIDVVIGSFCIDEGIPLLFSDRDFLPMVERLGLVPAIRPH